MRAVAILAVSALSLSLAACGSGTDPGDGADGDGPTKLAVAAIPISDYATVYYAEEKGYFDAEGLDVEIVPMEGGATAVPLLTGGEVQFAASNWTSYIQAVSRGLPVRAVLPGTQGAENFSAIVVDPAKVSGPADLADATIAVNQVKAISEFTTRVSMQDAGVDPNGVKFVEVPLPEMNAALERGNVDAAWVVEPFLSGAVAAGFEPVLDVYSGSLNGVPLGGWITSETYAAGNDETINAFGRAIGHAVKDLEDDATFAEFLPTFTAIPAEVASKVTFPTFAPSFEPEALQTQADQMAEFGFIDGEVDVVATLDHLRPSPDAAGEPPRS